MAADKQKKVAWYRSIQTKVTITLLVVTTLILGGFAAYNLYRAHRQLNQDLQELAQTTAQRLAQHVIGPLWALDKDQIADSIGAAMLEHRVQAIIVRDHDGKTNYVSRERDGQGHLVPVERDPQGDLVVKKLPLYHVSKIKGKELIGVLEVYITHRFVQQRFNQLMVSELGRLAVLDITIIIVTLLLLQRFLVGPIRRLTDATDHIAAGELNTRIDVHSRDEIGLLGDAIGKMQISLRIAMDRMRRGR